jgi:LysM repeat protein
MRNLFALFVISLSFYNTSSAQDKLILAEGKSPNLYITHTIAPKDNYYSVGRIYNASPKELAPYNELVFEKGLTLGQTIKIPLAANNFSQGEAAAENEVLIPVYHVVLEKESLARVSANYNKVPIAAIRNWNKLSKDAVRPGTNLIVGFLKVLKDQSPLASRAMNIDLSEVAIKPPAVKKQKVKIKENVKVAEPKETEPEVKEKSGDDATTVKTSGTINFNGGTFKNLYSDQTKSGTVENENGVAATFKTTSGWQDGKYYCFHNTAIPGSIMKITNTGNGKTVYAKVLDAIPDMKQNSGLLIRLSNSAAAELGATDKFDCTISYPK